MTREPMRVLRTAESVTVDESVPPRVVARPRYAIGQVVPDSVLGCRADRPAVRFDNGTVVRPTPKPSRPASTMDPP
jgi:hypothetical protein